MQSEDLWFYYDLIIRKLSFVIQKVKEFCEINVLNYDLFSAELLQKCYAFELLFFFMKKIKQLLCCFASVADFVFQA